MQAKQTNTIYYAVTDCQQAELFTTQEPYDSNSISTNHSCCKIATIVVSAWKNHRTLICHPRMYFGMNVFKNASACRICYVNTMDDSGFVLTEKPKYNEVKNTIIKSILELPTNYNTI
ncbi:unnamed protein product [Rotaria socialis]